MIPNKPTLDTSAFASHPLEYLGTHRPPWIRTQIAFRITQLVSELESKSEKAVVRMERDNGPADVRGMTI